MIDIISEGVDTSIQFKPLLKDLQGNILKGHGRNFAHHLFVSIDVDKIPIAKSWIAAFANTQITTAEKQLNDRDAHKANGVDGGPVFFLSVASTGYSKLGIPAAQQPGEISFKNGLKASAVKLADNPSEWDEPFRNNNSSIDLLIIVADDSSATAHMLAKNIETGVKTFGTLLHNQKGQILKKILPGGDTVNIEHFGYADGISQPLYLKDEISAQQNNLVWHDKEPLTLLLVKDKGGDTEASFGSYLVFRKLDQNVFEFKQNEGDEPGGTGPNTPLPRVKNDKGINNDDLPGAMIVGRFEDGTPTVLSKGDSANIQHPSQISNDFNYDTDAPGSRSQGSKCPFHAHIRITNPRLDVTETFAHSVRITRRGIPYDDVERFGKSDVIEVSEELLDEHRPKSGVGLLFMCYQADIASQFEFIQDVWVNRGLIGLRNVPQDGLIAQGLQSPLIPQTLPEQWGRATPLRQCTFGGHVKMKGGEYFFTPSISFLKSLSPLPAQTKKE